MVYLKEMARKASYVAGIIALSLIVLAFFNLALKVGFTDSQKEDISQMADKDAKQIDWKNMGEEFWVRRLTPEQYRVCRQSATECAYSGKHYENKSAGEYSCAGCGQKLFHSDSKFDSGTGWPSFYEALPGSVEFHEDRSLWMQRTEVRCSRCGSHLGHVFDDGPEPTGKRFCINSVCLDFKEEKP